MSSTCFETEGSKHVEDIKLYYSARYKSQKPISLFTFRDIIDGCCENYRRDVSLSVVWVKYRGFKCYSRCDMQLALGFRRLTLRLSVRM